MCHWWYVCVNDGLQWQVCRRKVYLLTIYFALQLTDLTDAKLLLVAQKNLDEEEMLNDAITLQITDGYHIINTVVHLTITASVSRWIRCMNNNNVKSFFKETTSRRVQNIRPDTPCRITPSSGESGFGLWKWFAFNHPFVFDISNVHYVYMGWVCASHPISYGKKLQLLLTFILLTLSY